MAFEYIKEYYKVPAEIGRRVIVNGEHGIIVEDRGHHIGVNLDKDKPGVVSSYHPTWKVEYKEMGKIRPLTAAQRRYQEYLDADWFDGSFAEWMGWAK